ncbi:PRP40 pre-mRNA processing factor 40, partial [Dinochytrium kinnereticum]
MDACPWKEYTSPGDGKKYYSNSVTKETVWEMPKELKEVLERFAAKLDGPAGSSAKMSLPPAPKPDDSLPKFDTEDDAKGAFMQLLSEAGVTVDWTWEQTMRAII